MTMIRRLLVVLMMFGSIGVNFYQPLFAKAEDSAALVAAEGRANIKVKGMHCEECNSAIVGQVKKVAGVRSVVADYKSGTANVTFDAGTSMEAISKAIEKAGYEVLEISPG